MTAPFMVKALFEYNSPHEDDLSFPAGQIITVTEVEDDDWYTGGYVDDSGVKHDGIFPRNFVERYEPVAPPRPTRTKTKKESDPTPTVAAATSPPPPAPPAVAAAAVTEPLDEPAPSEQQQQPPSHEAESRSVPELADNVAAPSTAASVTSPAAPEPSIPVPIAAPLAPVPKAEPAAFSPPKAASSAPKPSGPPPVAEKPTGNAFKDRIAAFNRAAAPPIAPFKPSGLGGSSFIKKPFVAPPPSRNAYIPQQQNAPTAKVYRRDEDPEIKEREQENLETAEKVGLAPTTSHEGEDDNQPKPLSLKERMALLQRQQQEQAQRHAEAVARKEKPKRPVKKRTGSNDAADEASLSQPALQPLERQDSEDTTGRRSVDESQASRTAPSGRRKSSAKGLGGEPHDGNEADMSGAGETTEGQEDVTEREDSDDRAPRVPRSSVAAGKAPAVEEAAEEDEQDEEGEDDEEEEEIDPEIRRREELRARMAKMSGGMGMAGMLGMPMPGLAAPAKKKKAPAALERRESEAPEGLPSPSFHAPPVPSMVALPGLAIRRSEDRTAEESTRSRREEEEDDDETPSQSAVSPPSVAMSAPPPLPGNRPGPPPVPSEARPSPAPPIPGVKSPSAGSESDDELSEHPMPEPLATPRVESTTASRAPPPPPPGAPPVEPSSPRSPGARQQSFFGGGDESSPTSTTAATSLSNKRASRPPPPIPMMIPASPPPATSRPPPPPPPGGLSRRSTADNRPLSPTKVNPKELSDEEEITEYEGDYDTDIASSVPHKDALKSHGRDSSIDETTSVSSPSTAAPPSLPPPIPSASAPRAPPPVPNQPPPTPKADYRKSVDMPRMAPPPPPPPKEAVQTDAEYDPYNYSVPSQSAPAPGYAQPPAKSPRSPEIPQGFHPPPPPPSGPQSSRTARQSLDVGRASHSGRRSVDLLGPPMESHYVANDIDLLPSSNWWTQPKGMPPQLQGRKDIFFESEQSVSAQGSKSIVTRDIYVLYHDYSQTVITVSYDAKNLVDPHLSQRHEPPPRSLRQDQLEQSYERFGRQIAEAVKGKKETVVGDGTPHGLIHELLRPHKDALMPVGTRAYGALVYANMANASTTVNDEIRPGDIMSIRNAKFSGKHGALGHKYSIEVGRPDHVAVVAEWDGSKKKVRVWEQGRESKKTKLESFRLDDLRSGEIKIWRVMPRSWVGWEGQN